MVTSSWTSPWNSTELICSLQYKWIGPSVLISSSRIVRIKWWIQMLLKDARGIQNHYLYTSFIHQLALDWHLYCALPLQVNINDPLNIWNINIDIVIPFKLVYASCTRIITQCYHFNPTCMAVIFYTQDVLSELSLL